MRAAKGRAMRPIFNPNGGFSMSRIVTACLALVLFVGLHGAARAQSEAGGQATLISPDVRADGMGRAFTAVANDANAIWWNTGAMAFARGRDVTLMYAPLVPDLSNDVNYSNLSYMQHSDIGGLGLSLAYLNYGKSEATDADGNTVGEFTSYELVPALAYGTDIGQNFGVGIALKLIHVDLAPANVTLDQKAGTGTSFAADFGTLYRVPSWKASFGATLNNIGPDIAYIDQDQSDPLGRNIRIGAAYSPIETDIHRVIVAADATRFLLPDRTYAIDVWDVGGEYTFNNLISLRAGYISDPVGTITSYTVGFGLAYKGLSFDYANVPQSEYLDRISRYSVGYRF
jgi:hypothetical protein